MLKGLISIYLLVFMVLVGLVFLVGEVQATCTMVSGVFEGCGNLPDDVCYNTSEGSAGSAYYSWAPNYCYCGGTVAPTCDNGTSGPGYYWNNYTCDTPCGSAPVPTPPGCTCNCGNNVTETCHFTRNGESLLRARLYSTWDNTNLKGIAYQRPWRDGTWGSNVPEYKNLTQVGESYPICPGWSQIRWDGDIRIPQTGPYTFRFSWHNAGEVLNTKDDGYLWINGQQIINDGMAVRHAVWTDVDTATSASINLNAGWHKIDILLQFRATGLDKLAHLQWTTPYNGSFHMVPYSLSGEPILRPCTVPNASIDGPIELVAGGAAGTYSASAGHRGANSGEIWSSPQSFQSWSLLASNASFPRTATFACPAAAAGQQYHLVTNAYRNTGTACTGNPFLNYNSISERNTSGALWNGWNFYDCGPNDVRTVTCIAPAAPAPPTLANVAVCETYNGLISGRNNLSWTRPTNTNSFELRFCTGSICTPSTGTVLVNGGNVLTFIHQGLNNLVTYRYQVRARIGTGTWSNWSNIITTTPNCAPPLTVNQACVAGVANTTSTWTGVRGMTNYQLRSCTGSCDPTTAGSQIYYGPNLSYTHSPLIHGSTYNYVVRGRNAASTYGAFSPIRSPLINCCPALPAPTTNAVPAQACTATSVNLQYTGTGTSYQLQLNDQIDSYTCTALGTCTNPNDHWVTDAASPYVWSGLQPGHTYAFRVRQINACGTWSLWSAWRSFTVPLCQPTCGAVGSCSAGTRTISVDRGLGVIGATQYEFSNCSGVGCLPNIVLTTTAVNPYEYSVADSSVYRHSVRAQAYVGVNGALVSSLDSLICQATTTCNYNLSGTVYYRPGAGGPVCSFDTGDVGTNLIDYAGVTGNAGVFSTTLTSPLMSSSVSSDGIYSFSNVPEGTRIVNLENFDNSAYELFCPGGGYSRSIALTSDVNDLDFFFRLRRDPWWQVVGGDVGAMGTTGLTVLSQIPGAYSGDRFIITSNPDLNQGVLVTVSNTSPDYGGGIGTTNPNNWWASSPFDLSSTEDYEYFRRQIIDGPDFDNTVTCGGGCDDALLVNGSGYHHYDGNMELDTAAALEITSAIRAIHLIDGTLEIKRNITVEPDGFVAFIVSGNIEISEDVSEVHGIYVTDGEFKVKGDGLDSDIQFNGQGMFVGWGSVALQRDLPDDIGEGPGETFTYRPDFVINAPDVLRRNTYFWKEMAP